MLRWQGRAAVYLRRGRGWGRAGRGSALPPPQPRQSAATREPHQPASVSLPALTCTAQEMSEEEVAAAEPPAMEGGEQPAPPPEEPPTQFRPSRDPDRPLKFRYWSRPTTLQYKYLYDYRHNYYSDVIDYLDNRSRGIKSDIPRPQTWAERALRTYTNPRKSEALAKREKDVELLNNIRASNFLYQYHTKDYLYRKYPALTL